MKIKTTIGGTKRTRDMLRRFAQRADVSANRAGDIMAERLIWWVQNLLDTGPKSGKLYKRYNPRRVHQASAPGQAPASDLRTLALSFTSEQTKINQYAYKNTVGSSLVYAAALQYGNPGTKLLPRPYFDVAIRLLRYEVQDILRQAWSSTA